VKQDFSPLTGEASIEASNGDGKAVLDGINRPVGNDRHAWSCRPGDELTLKFSSEKPVEQATLVVDSALQRLIALSCHQDDDQLTTVPPEMPRSFILEGLSNGKWDAIASVENNYQRLVRIPVKKNIRGIRFTLNQTWASPESSVQTLYLE
jgi:hypothetical protein